MMTKNLFHRSQRHERATRRAFIIWMAGYAAVLIAIVIAHGIAVYPSTALDIKAIRTLQARLVDGPQSALTTRDLETVAAIDDKG